MAEWKAKIAGMTGRATMISVIADEVRRTPPGAPAPPPKRPNRRCSAKCCLRAHGGGFARAGCLFGGLCPDAPQSSLGPLLAQDTVTGFLLAGVGEASAGVPTNYMVVDQGAPQRRGSGCQPPIAAAPDPRARLVLAETSQEAIADKFKAFTTDNNISVILISQEIASTIRWLIDDFDAPVPSILEIPTKAKPYNPEEDPTYERIKRLLGDSN